ncbi:MAG: GNAT family N-acetyltransferase [bacterium]
MVTITPVTRDDLDALFALTVGASQEGFVAPNTKSLAEIAYLPGAYAFAIRHDDLIVGLMGIVDCREYDALGSGDDPNAAFLMRLMIGEEFQRRGHGRAAMQLALTWAKSRQNSCFQTSFVPENAGAALFYASLGLQKTGRIVADEIEMSIDL